jgi:putative endonuclease
MKLPAVYVMANRYRGTIYTGVTSNLPSRVSQHRLGLIDGFTKKYALTSLVYFEPFATMELAIRREKQLKEWKREWKLALAEQTNPCWNDLFESLI